jgi:hypothetical protein
MRAADAAGSLRQSATRQENGNKTAEFCPETITRRAPLLDFDASTAKRQSRWRSSEFPESRLA